MERIPRRNPNAIIRPKQGESAKKVVVASAPKLLLKK